MLDLKAKLLQAGLVTEDQVQKAKDEQSAERERKKKAQQKRAQQRQGKGKGKRPHKKRPAKEGESPGDKKRNNKKPARQKKGPTSEVLWQKRIKELKAAPKSEQYDAIRNWVKRNRLDKEGGLPSDDAERFHFTRIEGSITWLTISPEQKEQIKKGEAGIIAFMSHHGESHALVPKALAQDVGTIRPEWVRVLEGFLVIERLPGAPAPDDESKVASADDDKKGEAALLQAEGENESPAPQDDAQEANAADALANASAPQGNDGDSA